MFTSYNGGSFGKVEMVIGIGNITLVRNVGCRLIFILKDVKHVLVGISSGKLDDITLVNEVGNSPKALVL